MIPQQIAVISQPRYLPSLNYIHRMMVSDHFIFLDSVQYSQRDYENRNKIPIANEAKWLSVPVIHDSQKQKISDTFIDNNQTWQKKHLDTLHKIYSKTKYFKDLIQDIDAIYACHWDKLVDLNWAFISYFCKLLNITCQFSFSSALQLNLTGEELLIEICKQVGATHYLSGPLGKNYICPENWEKNSIHLLYHHYSYPNYEQATTQSFIPWLSILDLLFNHGPEKSIEIIQQGNKNSVIEFTKESVNA